MGSHKRVIPDAGLIDFQQKREKKDETYNRNLGYGYVDREKYEKRIQQDTDDGLAESIVERFYRDRRERLPNSNQSDYKTMPEYTPIRKLVEKNRGEAEKLFKILGDRTSNSSNQIGIDVKTLEAIYSGVGGGFLSSRDIFPSASFVSFFGLGVKGKSEEEKLKESLKKLIEHAEKNNNGVSFLTLNLVYGSVEKARISLEALSPSNESSSPSPGSPSTGK